MAAKTKVRANPKGAGMGAIIERLLAQRGWSWYRLSLESGVAESRLGRIANDMALNLSLGNARLVAAALGVGLEEVLPKAEVAAAKPKRRCPECGCKLAAGWRGLCGACRAKGG